MPSQISDAIRSLRKELRLTQKALAARIGVRQSSISQYESGAVEPSPAVLLHLFDLSIGTPEEPVFRDHLGASVPIKKVEDAFLGAFDAVERMAGDSVQALEQALERAQGDPMSLLPLGKVARIWLMSPDAKTFESHLAELVGLTRDAGGATPKQQFVDRMAAFYDVADRDTIAIVENLAATRLRQHEREVQKRKEEGRKTG